MVGLLDIAPSNKSVETSFGKVDVPGLTLNALVHVVKRHPKLFDLIQGKTMELAFTEVADLGLDVAASVLAAGLGYPGDEAAEKRCKELKPEDALDLGQAILEESFPNGSKSFFDKVSKAMEKVNLKTQPQGTNSSIS